ncbi:hypothetical protein Rctr85_062 [Virus Rctr85]|nr:hypothetical protein Rctr85_062 [Virus Rctr85]
MNNPDPQRMSAALAQIYQMFLTSATVDAMVGTDGFAFSIGPKRVGDDRNDQSQLGSESHPIYHKSGDIYE